MKKKFPGARAIQCGPGREIHRAGTLIVSPWKMMENPYFVVENAIITEISKTGPRSAVYDHGPGVLMPGLVNAHVHLELTALKHKIPFDSGFQAWVTALLKERKAAGTEVLTLGAQQGLDDLINSGVPFAAEISTLGITKACVSASSLSGIWFHEVLGSKDNAEPLVKNSSAAFFKDPRGKMDISAAGHAPHTSSPGLLKTLKQNTSMKGLFFSIHGAESREESAFITGAKGEWAEFLKERGIDFSTWPVPCKSEIQYLDRLNLLDGKTIVVHLLNCSTGDFELMAEKRVKPVVCPRSNDYLHARLPDLHGMLKMGLKPALGTDSLASNDSLSMFDEMAFVSEKFPDISSETVFSMATIDGASALGIEKRAGSLEPGKKAVFSYLPLKPASLNDFLEKVTHYA
ncbi:MAG: amidohydrolase family protein [Thermodesulfobacteriota bacterium]|nr:amidohydrolase family protein [Thermodesulfobacteriota bacterium]